MFVPTRLARSFAQAKGNVSGGQGSVKLGLAAQYRHERRSPALLLLLIVILILFLPLFEIVFVLVLVLVLVLALECAPDFEHEHEHEHEHETIGRAALLGKPPQPQKPQRQIRLPRQRQIRQHLAQHARELEPVAREARGKQRVRMGRIAIDDKMLLRRHCVETDAVPP